MKPGDLVKLCKESYPQFKGNVGVLMYEDVPVSTIRGWWLLMVGGKIIQIHQDNLEVINESR
jgi:hypothetical protein